MEELRKEFEKKFVIDGLGEKQMILMSDEVNELWDWIIEKNKEAYIQGTDDCYASFTQSYRTEDK